MGKEPVGPAAPLAGFVIGITAHRRADEQIALLERRGASCLHAPVLTNEVLDPSGELEAVTQHLISDPPDIVVVLTAMGLVRWLDAAYLIGVGDDLRVVLGDSTVLTRGPKARGAALAADLEVAWSSPTAVSSELAAHLIDLDLDGRHIAIQLDGSLETDLQATLEQHGARVTPVPVYRWEPTPATANVEVLIRAIIERQVDAVTFVARPAVEELVSVALANGTLGQMIEAFEHDVLAACVGPVCAEAARHAGMRRVLSPVRFRLGSLVHLLVSHFEDRTSDVLLGGYRVCLQGRVATIDDTDRITLTDRERLVLQALIDASGAPRSKRALLTEVWDDSTADEHTVEVTIGRLRKRLGDAGRGIETVFRRGYRLSA